MVRLLWVSVQTAKTQSLISLRTERSNKSSNMRSRKPSNIFFYCCRCSPTHCSSSARRRNHFAPVCWFTGHKPRLNSDARPSLNLTQISRRNRRDEQHKNASNLWGLSCTPVCVYWTVLLHNSATQFFFCWECNRIEFLSSARLVCVCLCVCVETYLSRHTGGCKLLNHALTQDTWNVCSLSERGAVINILWCKRCEWLKMQALIFFPLHSKTPPVQAGNKRIKLRLLLEGSFCWRKKRFPPPLFTCHIEFP